MKTNSIKSTLIIFAIALTGSVSFTSCSKDDDNNSTPTEAPMLHIDLTHRAGNKLFMLDSTYTTFNGDSFTPTLFKYYISNVSLIKTDNTVVSIPDTYFLVSQDDESSRMIEMDNMPEGDFKAIRFVIGVDSARNVSGAQTGALDPVNGMFWSWNTGYIFYKLEGTSPAIGGTGGTFRYHIGGFQGTYNNIKTVEVDFDGDILSLEKGGHPELHLILDVLETFMNPTTIDLATFSTTVMSPNADAQTVANNYADMFRYDHIHVE
jgi:hypothetical protein